MLQFSCGDAVPGCSAVFIAPDHQSLLAALESHCRDQHLIGELPPCLIEAIRSGSLTIA